MSTTDNVNIWVKLRGAKQAAGEFKILGHEINDLGDEASKASRKIAKLNAAAIGTRVNIGPFTTSMRSGVLVLGAFTLGVEKLTPQVLAAAEATATLAGGAGAAGGQGLLAIAQGAGVAQLGLAGLADALGGNEKAAKNLSPELFDLFMVLRDSQDQIKETATHGLVPGLEKGTRAAMHNFGALNRIVAVTARTLGGLGEDAGMWLGDPKVGRDAVTVGRANARVMDDLGHSVLNLADAARHVLVEASPLTEWMSDSILHGTELADVWALNARNSGDMARFFREAHHDLSLLASIGGHTGHGIINLFGSNDVDGTKTLENLDRITKRFEDWTSSPAVRESLGDAIVAEIPDAVAAAMDAIAEHLPEAAGHGAKVFWDAFWNESVGGKALTAAIVASKLGGFKLLGRAFGCGAGKGAGGLGGGASLINGATPVWVMNPGFSTPGKPGTTTGPGATVTRGSTAAERQATRDWVTGRKAGPIDTVGRLGASGLSALAGLIPFGWQQDTFTGNDIPGLDTSAGAFERAKRRERAADAHANPMVERLLRNIGTNPGRPFGPVFDVTLITNVDGQRVEKSRQRVVARRRARQGR